MRQGPSRGVVKTVIGAAAFLGVCSLADRLAAADPMLPFEIGAAALLGLWAVALGRAMRRSLVLSSQLARHGRRQVTGAVGYRVIPGRTALVAGPLRPSIYLGAGLIASLSAAELAAVLLHEEHHRVTRAPLRTAALFAWLSILGWSTLARHAISERLFELERSADAYALRRGVSRAALAAALLHADAPRAAASAAFSSHADRRAVALLASAPDRHTGAVLPYEWLPLAVVTGVAGLCHLALIGLG